MAEPAAAALGTALATAVRQGDVSRIVAAAKAILDRAGLPPGAELRLEAEIGIRADDRWTDGLTPDEHLVARWLFAAAMARRGNAEARKVIDSEGPGGYVSALVGLLRAEASSAPSLPPGTDHQEVLVGEVLDAEIVDDDEEAA